MKAIKEKEIKIGKRGQTSYDYIHHNLYGLFNVKSMIARGQVFK